MEKILPRVERVRVESVGRAVECYDLSVAYMDRVEQDLGWDTARHAVEDATDLADEEIGRLRIGELRELYRIIVRLTNGERDGSAEDSGEGKK